MAAVVHLLFLLLILELLPADASAHTGFQETRKEETPELSEKDLGFLVEPGDQVVTKGRTLRLDCKPAVARPYSVTWFDGYFTGSMVPVNLSDPRIRVENNGSLTYKKFKGFGEASDVGTFCCLVNTTVGALLSRPATVRVTGISRDPELALKNLTVGEGETVRLPCQIISVPAARISWEKNNATLPQNNRFIQLKNGALYIKDAQTSDSGEYRCLGVNPETKKQKLSSSGYLTVVRSDSISSSTTKPLQFLSPSPPTNPLYLKQNDETQLECSAYAYPQVPELLWTANSPVDEIISQTHGGINVLSLKGALDLSGKSFSCKAFLQSDPSTIITQTTEIEIIVPPSITVAPESQELVAARTVFFKCAATGHPQPSIMWLKDGKPLLLEGRMRQEEEKILVDGVVVSNSSGTYQLSVGSTLASDSGIYQCVARNAGGTASAAARLFVNVTHQYPAPSELNCTTLSNSSIFVSWVQPRDWTPHAYSVHYYSNNVDEDRQPTQGTSYQINGLKPYTNYSIYVRSYAHHAPSDHSPTIHCTTGEAVPVAAPAVKVMPVSTTSAQVLWKPLTPEEAQGIIVEYKIQWRRVTQSSMYVEPAPGNMTDRIITGLSPGQKYEIRVTGRTQKGWPLQEFDWTEFEMPISMIPPAPDLHLFVISTNSIQAQWSYKWRVENLKGFKLSYRKKDSGDPLTTFPLFSINQTEFIINDLEMQTWYEVFLNVVTLLDEKEVDGENISRSIHTFPPETGKTFSALNIPAPTDLEAEPSSPTSINLTWTPPSYTNVSFYTVAYQEVPSTHREDEEFNYAHSTSNEIELKNLKPFTSYEMKVRTHDFANGFSEFSRKLEVKTKEDLPGHVQNVDFKVLNKSSVRLSWRKPNYANGIIVRYLISYLQDPTGPWRNLSVPGNLSSTDVIGLEANIPFFVRVQAETGAGIGPGNVTQFILVQPPKDGQQYSLGQPSSNRAPTVTPGDQFLGVVVGCSIGLCCIAMCTATLVLRRQCGKPPRCANNNGPMRDAANGNGYYHERTGCNERHELQCLTQHIDSKGGYQIGSLNGLRLPLCNSIQNGPLTAIRITENPHFIRDFDMRDRECGEGDSLLSGPLNETQLTSLGFGGEGSEEREEGGDSGLGNDRTESDHGLDGYRFSRTESDLDGCRLNADCKSMDEDSNQNSAPCSYYKFNNYKRPCSPIRKYSDPPDDGFCESHFSHYPPSHLATTVGPNS
nr:PREDICTED: protogenin-like [Bemisia tabaci]